MTTLAEKAVLVIGDNNDVIYTKDLRDEIMRNNPEWVIEKKKMYPNLKKTIEQIDAEIGALKTKNPKVFHVFDGEWQLSNQGWKMYKKLKEVKVEVIPERIEPKKIEPKRVVFSDFKNINNVCWKYGSLVIDMSKVSSTKELEKILNENSLYNKRISNLYYDFRKSSGLLKK